MNYMMTPRQIAEQGTFLVNEVGSSVHGTNLEGVDDLDLMGVCFQPTDYLLGLQHFEQYIYRTAEERERFNPESDQRKSGGQPPSRPGDIDLVIYSVQKYLRLALGGNPSVLVFLFSNKRHTQYEIDYTDSPENCAHWSAGFRNLAEVIASRGAGQKFLGYLIAQKQRLLGQRGQMRVTRTELIREYGYDTKYAMQACRLGLQGAEFMSTGRLQLPMAKPQADTLRALRGGALSFSEAIDWIDQLEEELKDAIDKSELPKYPDVGAVNKWLAENQLAFFEWLKQHQGSEYRAKLP